MPARQVVRSVFTIVFLLGAGFTATTAGDDQLGRALGEWQARSAAWTSVEVRFTGHERSAAWGDEPFSGRVILAPGGRALVEITHDKAGKSVVTERLIWTGDTLHQFRTEQKTHLIWRLADADRGWLPSVLTLPFLWHLKAEELTSRYEMTLLQPNAGPWVLSVVPRTKAGRETFTKAFLQIDQQTGMPRRYFLVKPDGRSTVDYRVTAASSNQPVDEQALRVPDDAGWNVIRPPDGQPAAWLRGLFKGDMLP